MQFREVESPVGLADGEIIGCERDHSVLRVNYHAWNSRVFDIIFTDVLLVIDLVPGYVSGLYTYEKEQAHMRSALAYSFEIQPQKHPYKHYAFLNNCGQPCLEVIAADMHIHLP